MTNPTDTSNSNSAKPVTPTSVDSNPPIDAPPSTPHLSLRGAIFRWLACGFALMAVAGPIGKYDQDFGVFIAIVGYLATGYYLNRTVLSRLVEWHPHFNTVANVSSSKLRFFVAWPIEYAKLFFSLIVNKVL
jgi:hypothetical protein